jgi:hypothetical protein
MQPLHVSQLNHVEGMMGMVLEVGRPILEPREYFCSLWSGI